MPKLLPKNFELSAAMQLDGDPRNLMEVDEESALTIDDTSPASSLTAIRQDQVDETANSQYPDDPSIPEADSAVTESVTSQFVVSGETIEENSASSGSPADYTSVVPNSFLEDYWPFMLFAAMFVFWVLSRILFRGDPSFRHHPIDPNKGLQPGNATGRFKKSERFLKSTNGEELIEEPLEPVTNKVKDAKEVKENRSESPTTESRLADPKKIKGKLTDKLQAETMQTDQPSDDEFDFDLSEDSADSDVFSLEDSGEIQEAAKDQKRSSSSKRFKTEADVEALGVKSDELNIDDDDFTFDDEDSQLSLADSDAEFGFDLEDEEPTNFLDSGNLAAGATAAVSPVADDDSSDLGLEGFTGAQDEGFGDQSLAGVQNAAQEAVDSAGDLGVKSGLAETTTAAAAAVGAVGAAAAVKKTGFFSRLFGGKKKGEISDVPLDESPPYGGADQIADVRDGFDGSDELESTDDLLGFDQVESAESEAVESLKDSDDDFDFDLEIDDDTSETAAVAVSDKDEINLVSDSGELGLDDSDDLGELLFDSDDSDEEDDAIEDAEVIEAVGVAPVEPTTEPKSKVESSEPLNLDEEEDWDLDSDDLDDSSELLFDSETSTEAENVDEDDAIEDAEVIEAVADHSPDLQVEVDSIEPSADDELDWDSNAAGSGELLLDQERSTEDDIEIEDDDMIEAVAATPVDLEKGVDTSESDADDELDWDVDAIDLNESMDDQEHATENAASTDATEVPKDEALVASADPSAKQEGEESSSAADSSDSSDFGFGVFDDQPSQSTEVEVLDVDVDASTATPVADATPASSATPVVAAAALGAGLAGLALTGSGADSDSDSAKELKSKLSTLEGKNKELSAQVSALKGQLDNAASAKAESDTRSSQLIESEKQSKKLTETVESLTSERVQLVEEKDKIAEENKSLAEELSATKEQHSSWEQEKADLLKQQEEWAAEKKALSAELETATTEQETSLSELKSLKAEVAAFADERSSFESQVKTLETKLSEAEEASTTSDSGSEEDVEDLRQRFKLRLASEHRKRKEAEIQVDQAEAQRNEVAKLLRVAKAELLALQSKQDDDQDFELAD